MKTTTTDIPQTRQPPAVLTVVGLEGVEVGSSTSGGNSSAYAWSDMIDTSMLTQATSLLQRVSFAIITHPITRWASTLLVLLQLLQLILVPLAPIISSSATGTSSAWDVVSFIAHLPIDFGLSPANTAVTTQHSALSAMVVGWTVVGVGIVCLALFAWELVSVRRGILLLGRINTIIHTATHYCFDVLPLLLIPALSFSIANFTASSTPITATGHRVALGITQILVIIPASLYTCVYHSPGFIPAFNHDWAQHSARFSLLLNLSKLCFALLLSLADPQNLSTLRSFLTFVIFSVLFVLYCYFVPHYKDRANVIWCGGLGCCSFISLMSFLVTVINSSSATSSRIILWITLALMVPSALMGSLAVALRLRFLTSKLVKHVTCASVKYPFQLDLLLHPTYNQSLSHPHPGMPDRSLIEEMCGRFIDKFPLSSSPQISLAVYLLSQLECKATIVHAKLAKRMDDNYPDTKFMINTLIQYAHEASQDQENGGNGRREMEVLLETAARHHKMAKTVAWRFWEEVERKKVELDSPGVMQMMSQFQTHESKAENILKSLVEKYPMNFRVLRQFAKFMDEIKNDKEVATQAYVLADEYEDETNKKHKSQNRSKSVKVVMAAPPPPPQQQTQQQQQETATVVDNSDAMSATSSSIASSAAASSTTNGSNGGTTELFRMRLMRKKLGSKQSPAAQRLMIGFVVVICVLTCLCIIDYIAVTQTLAKYLKHVSVVNSGLGIQATLNGGLYFSRKRQQETIKTNTTCTKILSRAATLNTELTSMWMESKVSTTVSDLWSDGSLTVHSYVRGANQSDLASGALYSSNAAMWDVGMTIICSMNMLCDDSYSSWSDSSLATDPYFVTLMSDTPTEFINQQEKLSTVYNNLLQSDITAVKISMWTLFSSHWCVLVVSVVLFLSLSYYNITRERRAAATMFSGVTKPMILNVKDRLFSDDIHDTKDTKSTRGAMNFLLVAMLQIIFSFLVIVGIGSAMFGVTYSFTNKYSFTGNTLTAGGQRRMLVGALRYWAQEYAVQDSSMRQLNVTHSILLSDLDEMSALDRQLKYGDEENGIYSFIRTDAKLFELWYDRACPDYMNLTDCYGLASMVRYFIDEVTLFAAETDCDHVTVSNTHYKNLATCADDLGSWLVEVLTLIYKGVVTANNTTRGSLQGCLIASIVAMCMVTVAMMVSVNKLSVESTTLMRMLLFLPAGDLDSIWEIKRYVDEESADLIHMKTTNENNEVVDTTTQQQPQQQTQETTKNLLDGCEDAVVIVGPLGMIELFNPAAEQLSGYTAADVLGQPITTIIPQDTNKRKFITRLMTQTTDKEEDSAHHNKKQKKKSKEVVVHTKSGRNMTCLVSVAKSVVKGRMTTALFIRDISEIKCHEEQLQQQKKLAEKFLCNILPKDLVKQLSQQQQQQKTSTIVQEYEEVTVLFADIVQFTNMSSGMRPEKLVEMLNEIISDWDKLALELGVEKIKTIGDCYMACAGVPVPFADHAVVCMEFAVAMIKSLNEFNVRHNMNISIRVGMNTGKVIAGVLGLHKMAYDLWGETVAVAERMESSGFPNRIHVSKVTWEKVRNNKSMNWVFESRGLVSCKGHGEVEGYLYVPNDDDGDEDDVGENEGGKLKHEESMVSSNNSVFSPRSSTTTATTSASAIGGGDGGGVTTRTASATSTHTAAINAMATTTTTMVKGPTAMTTINDFAIPVSQSINEFYSSIQ